VAARVARMVGGQGAWSSSDAAAVADPLSVKTAS
jgi:hypothetical protein